ncbi:MAG: hypothetical protein J2P13_12880 [Acidobacteria bacterium]|nr:hypothetical protein [Acidobacteriota bacterium]
MNHLWPWLTLLLLGAYHGLNPAMGWLFALSLGLQEGSRRALVTALALIAIGHSAAISLTVLTLSFFEAALSPRILRPLVALALFGTGIWRFFRGRHPKGGGMRVGKRELAGWAFAMASVHGAGLMLAPILMASPVSPMEHSIHHAAGSIADSGIKGLTLAVIVHTAGLLLAAGALAFGVYHSYEKWGLGLLRRSWFNFDLLWAAALMIAGLALLVV